MRALLAALAVLLTAPAAAQQSMMGFFGPAVITGANPAPEIDTGYVAYCNQAWSPGANVCHVTQSTGGTNRLLACSVTQGYAGIVPTVTATGLTFCHPVASTTDGGNKTDIFLAWAASQQSSTDISFDFGTTGAMNVSVVCVPYTGSRDQCSLTVDVDYAQGATRSGPGTTSSQSITTIGTNSRVFAAGQWYAGTAIPTVDGTMTSIQGYLSWSGASAHWSGQVTTATASPSAVSTGATSTTSETWTIGAVEIRNAP